MILKFFLCMIIEIWIVNGNTTESSPTIAPTISTKNESFHSTPRANNMDSMRPPSFFDLQNMHTTIVHGMPCVCNLGFRSTSLRDDYHLTEGVGAHKLHSRAATWNEARKTCNDEGGHLAIINSKREADVLMDLFNKSEPIKNASYDNVAFLGIHDLYKEGEWVNVLGDSLSKSGYTRWSNEWGGQPDNGGGKQNCGVFMKDGTLDDVSCDVPFAFFCEIPRLQFLH
ncbi:hemolymph lipopolysaccharide-binding protein-like [Leptopilina boulardi]|uniref:hemolymph lipopolysaccharide-binding protein-like n=1 Tax=Leptopilina boulardi TaxID=63433 RepID=UPI0021F53DF5|nr:hemolymph lipopolysaccharide-binding protein-like [Leptopilina boulardi]